jgi:simple sugar transport system permease protein
VIGETITERSGVINLSVNGTILLTAMSGFVVAVKTDSVLLGCLAGMLVGALVALIVAFSSITLRQSQVAVGFILALMCRDLSYFLGNPYMGMSGPRLPAMPLPILSQIPILGPLFFRQDLLTYLSYVLILLAWVWVFKTRPADSAGDQRATRCRLRAQRRCHRLRYMYTARRR